MPLVFSPIEFLTFLISNHSFHIIYFWLFLSFLHRGSSPEKEITCLGPPQLLLCAGPALSTGGPFSEADLPGFTTFPYSLNLTQISALIPTLSSLHVAVSSKP